MYIYDETYQPIMYEVRAKLASSSRTSPMVTEICVPVAKGYLLQPMVVWLASSERSFADVARRLTRHAHRRS